MKKVDEFCFLKIAKLQVNSFWLLELRIRNVDLNYISFITDTYISYFTLWRLF